MKFNLTGSFKMLVSLMALFGVYKFITVIWLLIFGSTANTATSGSITIPNGTNNTITSVVTGYNTSITSFIAADTIIIGLIGLAVILTLFWPMIEPYMPSSKKKSGFN